MDAEPGRGGASPGGGAPSGGGAGSVEDRSVCRGLRLHGMLDLGFAALYAWLGFSVAPGRHPAWNAALAAVIALVFAAGLALLARVRFARPIAIAAQLALLLLCAAAVVLLVASAAYLRGVYGPIGRGLALVALVVAALGVELCGLLPLFQLRFLLRPDVARHLGRDA